MSPFYVKKALVSNKPPEPVPTPSEELFPIVKTMPSDGRKIWISAPQPDRLTLIIPVWSYVYGANLPQQLPVDEFLGRLEEHLLSEPSNAHFLASEKFSSGWKSITLAIGGRHSPVRFEKLKNKKDGTRLKIECNPRKLGPAGFKQLAAVLDDGNGPFRLEKLIEVARISRLDLAIDLVGLDITEIVAWHKFQGKRATYTGNDGKLETLYIYRKKPHKTCVEGDASKPKKMANPAGSLLFRIYDRVRERADRNKPPPFGPAPVTRFELVLKRFVKWRALTTLPAMDDRFAELRIGFIESQAKPTANMRRYHAIRRSLGDQASADLLNAHPVIANQFKEIDLVPDPDLITKGVNWGFWQTGLKATGLMSFLKSGEK